MFNKKILASSLIAMALSLGVHAGKGEKKGQWREVQVQQEDSKACDQSQQESKACDQSQQDSKACDQSQQESKACDQSQQSSKSACDQSQQVIVAEQCDNSQQISQQFSEQCAVQSKISQDAGQSSQMASQCASQMSEQSQCGAILAQGSCSNSWVVGASLGKHLKTHSLTLSHYKVHGHSWDGKRLSGKFKKRTVTFEHNHFHDAHFSRLTFSKSKFSNNHWNGTMHKVRFHNSTIENCSLMGHINGVSFAGTHITNTSFKGAYLGLAHGHVHSITTSFDGATLENVDFAGAYIFKGVTFHNATLGHNVNFVGAYVQVDEKHFQMVTPDMASVLQANFATLANRGLDLASFLVDGTFATAGAVGHLALGGVSAVASGIRAANNELHVASHLALDHIRGLFNARGSNIDPLCQTNTHITVSSCNSNLSCH